MLPRAVQAVIFDMDGLLVDTEVLFRDAMMGAARDLGHELPEAVQHRLIGGSFAAERVILQAHFGAGFDLDDYYLRIRETYDVLAVAGPALKAGVVELLDHLDQAGLPRAIATSSSHRDVTRNLSPHGLKDRFGAIIANGDYARGKPHPDPFLAVATALGVDAEHCLALEDSHNGVRAATAAGMMTIMVPDLLLPTDEMKQLCVTISESLHEVLALIAQSKEPV